MRLASNRWQRNGAEGFANEAGWLVHFMVNYRNEEPILKTEIDKILTGD